MSDQHQKMLDLVAKLLRQAEDAELNDRPGEAEAFKDKAFTLMAKHNIDEALARAHRDGLDITEAAKAANIHVHLVGSYQHAQLDLLYRVCGALHCQAIQLSGRKAVLRVYGMPDHLQQLRDIWTLIAPQAQHGMTTAHPGPGASAAEVGTFRRSWLKGFAKEICARIAKAEDVAAVGTTALELYKSDKERAEEAMHGDYPHTTTTRSHGAIDSTAYANGGSAGRSAQLNRSVTT
jgi:hypothetical protein